MGLEVYFEGDILSALASAAQTGMDYGRMMDTLDLTPDQRRVLESYQQGRADALSELVTQFSRRRIRVARGTRLAQLAALLND